MVASVLSGLYVYGFLMRGSATLIHYSPELVLKGARAFRMARRTSSFPKTVQSIILSDLFLFFS
jgi:hypothetical protein